MILSASSLNDPDPVSIKAKIAPGSRLDELETTLES
jgi:hypothetical protein